MSCRLLRKHAGAFVDGEVDPGTMIEFERHIEACASCQELVEFERRFRGLVSESLGGVTAPSSLRQRVALSLDERDREASAPRAFFRIVRPSGRHALPLAAAAAVMLAVGGAIGGVPEGSFATTEAASSGLFEDVVRLHSSQLPPDVRADAPAPVIRYFRDKVEFPVRPVRFDRADVRLLGGRLSNVRERRAAAFFYDVRGRRMTLVVFHAPELVRNAFRLRFDGQDLLYRDVSGHLVPVRHRAGLAYAFAGDLDREALMRLAATARLRD